MEIQKRQRSPSVPVIGLYKSIWRTIEISNRVGRDSLSPEDMATIWGLAPKSSGASRTAAALRAYGLIEKSGGRHQMRVSDLAALLLNAPPQAEVLQQTCAAAALKPKLIADYAARWCGGRPADDACVAQLQNLHRFTAPAAAAFLPVFDEAMFFAGGGATGVFPAIPDEPPFSTDIKIGDYVQTRSDSADGSPTPLRVVWITDAGRHLYLEKNLFSYPAMAVKRIAVSVPLAEGDSMPSAGAIPTSERNPEQRLSFPRIQLMWAVERTYELLEAVGRKWVSIIDAANHWYETPDTRTVLQMAAGLCDFGFAEQSGRGKSRKLRVTDLGWRVVVGTEEARIRALSEAVSKPSLITHYARKWKGRSPPTASAVDEVMREQRLTDKRASLFMVIFNQCIRFVRLDRADPPASTARTECVPLPAPVIVENRPDRHPDMPVPGPSPVLIESRPLQPPELSPADSPAVCVECQPAPPLVKSPFHKNVLNIEQHGHRLEISASLDLAGVIQLKEVLPYYEAILELLVPTQLQPAEASKAR